MMIPINRPFLTGDESRNIGAVLEELHLSGDGRFTKECHARLEAMTGARKALLTHSCTAALEMAALLLDLQPGDEVIMPSFTFVSTANAFVLRGAVPVFVDVRPDTFNLDEALVEAAITPRTRAICVVHYAGVSCNMDAFSDICERHGLALVEDAAQGINATYCGRPLGTLGDLGALSFHETKNVISGEGGALLLRDERFVDRAEIIREKGTNRSRFFRGQVDKYTWVDVGSSYLPSEIIAAFLSAQLEHSGDINARRLAIWDRYHEHLAAHEGAGQLRRPVVPDECVHNAHMYYVLLPDIESRSRFIEGMKARGVATVFHYVPLHSAPMGSQVGRTVGSLSVTDDVGGRLVRLPLWAGLEPHLQAVLEAIDATLGR